jgi:outer membrane protein, heavy metal efflux system
LKFWPVILALGLLAGCARFQSKPLSPAKTATELDTRSLDSPGLKAFLETNLHHELKPWPAAKWDFDMLSLAAFYYNPSLEVARADWRVASSGVETAAERPNPTATATGVYEPAEGAFSPWVPGLVFDLPLETAGKRRFRTEQARHLSESARCNIATAAWQVRSQLRAALLDFAAARQRVDLLRRQAALREDLLSRIQGQLEAGAVSRIELNTARLALIRARADLADGERLLAEARSSVAGGLGLSAAALNGLDFEFNLAPPATAEALTAAQVRRLALLGRADIRAAVSDYAASQSALQLEVAKQYPDIHLLPGYFWNAGSTGEHDWQIGATVELPLLNRHQGPIAEASARREASAARFLALQAKVITQIDGAVASFRAAQTNVAAIQALTAAQETQQQSVNAQFQAGALDRLDVLTADLELNTASLARLDTQVKLQQAVGALEDAVQRPLDLPESIWQTTPKASKAANASP